jgi:hypothetical protein
MDKHTYKRIPISSLYLDLENPRHDVLPDQAHVIRTFLERNGDKLLRLARDVVSEGTNPADLPIVVPHPTVSEAFVVVEGNRRVAVIKILKDPSLASFAPTPSLKRRFEDLAKEFSSTSLDEVECVIFENKIDANHWIELRHTGENEGVGIVPWDAAAVARFKKGQSWMALQVADFVRAKAPLDDATKEKIGKMPITNLARLVNDPDVRDAIGIRAEKGSLKGVLPETDLVRGLSRVVTDVATGTITVNNIRSKAQRQEYVERLVKSGALPPSTMKPISPWDLPAVYPRPTAGRGRPPTKTRKSLIPSRCALRIPHVRIARICRELKLLDADQFTNSAAVMLRVFLELSLDEYIRANKVSVPGKGTLAQKLRAVADYLEKTGLLDRAALKAVRVAASSRDALFSTDTLHAYVHNKDFAPKASDLKITWDNMQMFMEAIWPYRTAQAIK